MQPSDTGGSLHLSVTDLFPTDDGPLASGLG